jgi:hypothetical protein
MEISLFSSQVEDQKVDSSESDDSEADDQPIMPLIIQTDRLKSTSPEHKRVLFKEEHPELKKVEDDPPVEKPKRRCEPAKKEADRWQLCDPGETHATRLRNQRARQRLALEHERARIEAEEESDRKERRRNAGRRIEPELRRLAAASKERQQKVGRGVEGDDKAVELRRIMKNVKKTEEIVCRNDRAIIMMEVQNIKRKEAAKQAEARRSQRRDGGRKGV